MRYWVRTLVGVLLIAGSVALASVLIHDLVRIGSCGSDGTSIAVRPCPDGTGLKILGLIISIFVAPFAGMALLATRHAGGAQRGPAAASVGVVWFFLLFTCMGAASFVAGRGPAAPTSPGLDRRDLHADGRAGAAGHGVADAAGPGDARRPRARGRAARPAALGHPAPVVRHHAGVKGGRHGDARRLSARTTSRRGARRASRR